jgi:hypothetical protein
MNNDVIIFSLILNIWAQEIVCVKSTDIEE